MSEVTQKDLKELERYFDEKFYKLYKQNNMLSIKFARMEKNIEIMPKQIKAEKYDNFREKYEAPIITGVIVGVVLVLVKIIFHV